LAEVEFDESEQFSFMVEGHGEGAGLATGSFCNLGTTRWVVNQAS
jgi:hypothetical protein